MDLKEWVNYCSKLRSLLMKNDNGVNKYLLANFSGTSQQKDIEKRTPLIGDFYRVKINVKAFDEKEMGKKDLPVVDFTDYQQVSDGLRDEFDMPQWAHLTLHNRPLQDFNNILISQIKGCNLRCPWCYVDDSNKNSIQGGGAEYFSVPEILDVFEKERKKQPLYMIRPSGGEPTLAIEQWPEFLRELRKRGLEKEVYMQGDTNLTTGHFIEYLEDKGEIEPNLLEKVAEFKNQGILCSFKGTDTESFLRASGMTHHNGIPNMEYGFLEQERWYSFGKLIDAGIDAYPFIYDPNPETLKWFMEEGADKFGNGFYLKTRLFKLKLYGPEKERYAKIGKDPEKEQERLDNNFEQSCDILNDLIQRKLGVPYGAIPRTGIQLENQTN